MVLCTNFHVGRRAKGLAASLAVVVLSSCFGGGIGPGGVQSSGLTDYDDITTAARYLDVVAEGVDAYGVVSVSAAAVVRKPGNFLGFRLELTPEQIFRENDQRVQAASRSLDSLAVEARIAASIKLLKEANLTDDPEKAAEMRGQAEGVLAKAAVEAATGETPPAEKPAPGGETPPTGGASEPDSSGSADPDGQSDEEAARDALNLPSGNPAKNVLHGAEFSPGYDKRAAETLRLPLRQLIKMAFDDHTTLKLFEWMSQPEEYGLADSKELFAAILNVNIRPGRRTYEGYQGEVDVQVKYGRGNVKLRGGIAPLAWAAFPALDTQVEDLRSSVRRQLSTAILLEALLPKADVQARLDTARRLEQDVASISSRNTVTGYNMNGLHFGWHFSPRLEAQGDPSELGSRPELLLEPDSFPAIVFIIADHDDLRDGGGKATSFIFETSTRWSRAGAPSADQSWLPFARERHDAAHPRLDEVQLADWAWRIEAVHRLAKPHCDAGWSAWDVICKRLRMFYGLGLGWDAYASIPTEKPATAPVCTGTEYQGWQNRKTVIVVSGRHFKGQVHGATVGTRLCTTQVPSDDTVVISCDDWEARKHKDEEFPIHLITSHGRMRVGTVEFPYEGDKKAAKLEPFATLAEKYLVGDAKEPKLKFAIDDTKLPPGHAGYVLYARPAADPKADFAKLLDGPTFAVDKQSLAIDFAAPTPPPAWLGKNPTVLEIDLRMRLDPQAQPTSVLVQPTGAKVTLVYFPTAGSMAITPKPLTITFEKDGSTKALEFSPDLKTLEAWHPDVENAANPHLVIEKPSKLLLPLTRARSGFQVEPEELEAQLRPLMKDPTKPVAIKSADMHLDVDGIDGKPIRISGDLTLEQKK